MLKTRFRKSTILCFVACLALCAFLAGCTRFTTQKDNQSPESQKSNQTAMNNEETVFACNPSALDKEQRARYSVLTKQLIAAKQELRELPDGYAFHFPANSQAIKDVAEFITYERLCCPFLNFEMAVEGENLLVRLKGKEGVREFIKMEFGI
ncbi:MAG: hypothetical protein M3388_07910 [Acidobacteriota bacterium]|nr:hypothetical protein [Acidobacteriota bacterium]